MRRHYNHIYRSGWHLAVTLFFIIAPLACLFFFAAAAGQKPFIVFDVVGVSLLRLVIAFLIAAFLGWLFAITFYHGKRSLVALPIFDVLQSFPTFAALPIAILFLGHSNVTVIVFLVMTIIWPIFFSVLSALKLIRQDWQDAVTIAGLSGKNYFRYFLWPVSIPALITGSIIGLGEGWEALVATEIIIGMKSGLGSFFQTISKSPMLTAVGVFSLLAIIFSINKLIWLPLLEWSHHTMDE